MGRPRHLPLWGTNCLLEDVGVTAGVPQTADHFFALRKSAAEGHSPAEKVAVTVGYPRLQTSLL